MIKRLGNNMYVISEFGDIPEDDLEEEFMEEIFEKDVRWNGMKQARFNRDVWNKFNPHRTPESADELDDFYKEVMKHERKN